LRDGGGLGMDGTRDRAEQNEQEQTSLKPNAVHICF
jgi:hypothetical protein